MQKYDLVSRSL